MSVDPLRAFTPRGNCSWPLRSEPEALSASAAAGGGLSPRIEAVRIGAVLLPQLAGSGERKRAQALIGRVVQIEARTGALAKESKCRSQLSGSEPLMAFTIVSPGPPMTVFHLTGSQQGRRSSFPNVAWPYLRVVTRRAAALPLGDMAAGQRYTLMIGFSNDIKTPQRTTFRLSHDRLFLKRHVETMQLGGSGWTWTLSTDAGTPINDVADSARAIDKKLEDLNNLTTTVWSDMRPQSTGGEHLAPKEGATCGWKLFFYHDHNHFICQNCYVRFEIVDCSCVDVRWCEHRPTPAQSRRTATHYQ